MSTPTMRRGRRRVMGRVLVVTVAAVVAVLALPVPPSLRGAGAPAAVVLAVLDVALGSRTGWLAFRRGRHLDERERAVRAAAYRRAFRISGLGLVLMLLAGGFGSNGDGRPVALFGPMGLRQLVAVVEMFAVLPSAVLVWTGEDRAIVDMPDDVRPPRPSARALVMAAVAAAAAGAWLSMPAYLPTRVVSSVDRHPSLSVVGARCATVTAVREIGLASAGAITLHATACWDGRAAWIFGDWSLPAPPGRTSPVVGPIPDLVADTDCDLRRGTDDMALLSAPRCTGAVEPDGSYRYSVRADAAPAVAPWLKRTLGLDLVVSRDGRDIQVLPA